MFDPQWQTLNGSLPFNLTAGFKFHSHKIGYVNPWTCKGYQGNTVPHERLDRRIRAVQGLSTPGVFHGAHIQLHGSDLRLDVPSGHIFSGATGMNLVEGMSVRDASRVFEVHRDPVRKMLANATPAALHAAAGRLTSRILEHRHDSRHTGVSDSRSPKKQRHQRRSASLSGAGRVRLS